MTNKIKQIPLLLEIELSIFYIMAGIKEVKNISLSNDFYHLPILCLSTGFERLMKCIILSDFYVLQSKLVSKGYLKNYLGHNLMKLLNEVIKIGEKSQA